MRTYIRHFQIEAEVGRGSSGVVYRAWDTRLHRRIALKMLAPDLLNNAAAWRRFQVEAQAAARLRHPHIAIVYELGMHAGQPYIVSEWVEGVTLQTLLRQGPLPLARALKLAAQLAAALDYAHAQGVIHRDVKPSNILIAPDDHVVLVDFGLAQLTAVSSLTLSHTTVGTPQYIAPEQISGEPVDGRADVYSLGIVIYEMLAGRPPFVRDSTPALLYAHLHTPPPPLTEFAPHLPLSVEHALNRALAKNPSHRFPDAQSLITALQAAATPVHYPRHHRLLVRRWGMTRHHARSTLAKSVSGVMARQWLLVLVLGIAILGIGIAGGYQGFFSAPLTRRTPAADEDMLLTPRSATATVATPLPSPTAVATLTNVHPPSRNVPSTATRAWPAGLWPMPGGDAAQTGFVAAGLARLSPTPRWSQNPRLGDCTGLVAGYGRVVIVSRIGLATALEWGNGLPAWVIPLAGEPTAPAIYSDNTRPLVIIPLDGSIEIFDLKSGEFERSVTLEDGGHVFVTVSTQGRIYAATDRGWVYALNPSDGTIQWSLDLSASGILPHPPAIAESTLFLAGTSEEVIYVDVETGRVITSAGTIGKPVIGPVAAADLNLVFIGSEEKWIQASGMADGSKRWAVQTRDLPTGLAYAGHRVYVTTPRGEVYTLDASSGIVAWRWSAGTELPMPPRTDGRSVLIATSDGELRYLDAVSGQERKEQRIRLDAPLACSPAHAGDALFVMTEKQVHGLGP